jgi:hypothetical protein
MALPRPNYRDMGKSTGNQLSSTLDENFKRVEKDISRLQDRNLEASNSAPGTVLGSVVRKIEVFDKDGNSLGFLALYDEIT